ncbi:MAG: nucleotide exchange factor GrpE [Clostridia bacterium]|nr:nucleotide exchange factor GrpE [Clostridia bacterium]
MTEDKNIAAEEQGKTPEAEATEEIESIKEIEEIEEIEEVEQTDKKESRADKKKVKKLEAKIADLESELEKKAQELSEQNDKYMRMMAEYDNFRKRSAKEREGTYADAYADALASILPIIDNLERAVGVTEADGVLKGLEMTLKGADEALKKMGVEAFGAEGEAFDPNIHNAVMMVDDENHKEGEIVSVFQKGYKKGDKIIRYAMVTVAN